MSKIKFRMTPRLANALIALAVALDELSPNVERKPRPKASKKASKKAA